ncbi:MAG: DUF177 domain-containing protein [Brumimicrobium sp.]|nr:DUF177 domain-containing protein [Brumimicrobium sp.]MCO5267404.1 DUF177 domain-containing protein [Brumimicrobium sp.]
MSSNKDFEIPFEGLKLGKHNYEFKITDTFFEELTYSIIEGADVDVAFTLEKKETMLIGEFSIKGIVRKTCDRCTDLMEFPIEIEHKLVYKFDNEMSDDENLINIPSSDHSINIAGMIYELMTVAIPSRTIHEEGECNEEMLSLLKKYVNSEEKDYPNKGNTDPRWDALKNLN